MGTIGERLKLERERLRLTQEKLAEHGGVLKRSQVNYEKGDRFPDAKYLEGVAKSGVDISYVLTGQRSAPSAIDVPAQQSCSPALQIEETTAGYDLGQPTKAKSQNDNGGHELAEMRAEMEVLKLQAEIARKEAEAAKAQARAEIAEAKQQLLQSQMDDLKNTLKRTEHELAQTKVTLSKVHNQLSMSDKQNKVA